MNEKNVITEYTSKKIYQIGFLLSVLVVFLHISSTNTTCYKELTFAVFFDQNVEYFIPEIIVKEIFSRIAVPFFFVISGFFLFRNYQNTRAFYKRNLIKKYKSLFIPYLCFNLLGLFSFILFSFYGGRLERLSSISIEKFFLYGYNGPLWFVFQLLLFNILSFILYPLIKNKYFSIISLFCVVLVYVIFNNVELYSIDERSITFNFNSLFFFLLGGIISIHYFEFFNNRKIKFFTLFIILFIVIKLFLLFKLANYEILQNRLWYGRGLNIIALLCGVLACWSGYELIDFQKIVKDKMIYVEKHAFFIYFAHAPLLSFFSKSVKYFIHNPQYSFLFVLITTLIVVCCILVFILFLKKCLPSLYSFVSGNR